MNPGHIDSWSEVGEKIRLSEEDVGRLSKAFFAVIAAPEDPDPGGGVMNLADWIDSYARAWETADEDLVVSLFTDDARYRSSPFREPHVGHEQIRDYWRRAAGTQRETHVRMGRPFLDGDRVAVEWWTTMIDEDEEVTLPGCLLLRFGADGRCISLREYWNVESGRSEPFADWGS